MSEIGIYSYSQQLFNYITALDAEYGDRHEVQLVCGDVKMRLRAISYLLPHTLVFIGVEENGTIRHLLQDCEHLAISLRPIATRTSKEAKPEVVFSETGDYISLSSLGLQVKSPAVGITAI